MITQTYDINLIPSSLVTLVRCSQYDTDLRTLVFNLYDDETLFDATGYTVRLGGTKPDKTGFLYDMTVNGSQVSLVITEQMTAVAGPTVCEITVYDSNGGRVSTVNFILQVERSALAGTEISETEIPLLQEAIDASATVISLSETFGSPLVAQTAAEMTLTNRVYVYTGSESGYTAGNWYYYDGSAWVSGGVYQSAAVAVDSALSTTSQNPVQNKVITEEITDLKSAFEEFPTGSYPDMSVGEVFSDDSYTSDQTPYLYRVSGGGVEVGKVEADTIVGGTVAWNQIVQNGNFESGERWNRNRVTGAYADNVATWVVSATSYKYVSAYNSIDTVIDHKYLVTADFKAVTGDTTAFGLFFLNAEKRQNTPVTGQWFTLANVLSADRASTQLILQSYYKDITTSDSYQTRNAMVFDLTQMFGSAVADMIYAMETANAGAGVAFFRSLFPNDYYEYNAGELKSVEGLSAHVMRDADNNIIGNYPLDSSLNLRGISKLDASNNLYYDGDVYSADGKVQRKYAIITITGNNIFTVDTASSGVKYAEVRLSAAGKNNLNVIANRRYLPSAIVPSKEGYIRILGIRIFVYDNAFTDLETTKSLMDANPLTVVYELATPTEETAQAYTEYQKVSKYGTEEYVTSGIVPVGHVTKYPADIVSKVDGLPSDFSTLIAPTEKGFTATRNYTVNQFLIVSNQLYRVTATIANGATITPNTNVTAVTVADILTSLLNA